jgi:hypothetical protein
MNLKNISKKIAFFLFLRLPLSHLLVYRYANKKDLFEQHLFNTLLF